MFDTLFTQPSIIARHINAPYREERERYLRHCHQQGYTRSTLLLMARELLWIALKIPISAEQGVTIEQVRAAASGWRKRERFCGQKLSCRWTRIRFIQVARTWLRFSGYWREPQQSIPFEPLLVDFHRWMHEERGFTAMTIERRCRLLKQFLHWYAQQGRPFPSVGLTEVDAFLADYGRRGNCRTSVKNMASVLRTFLGYAGSQGWCSSRVAKEIHGPRLFAQERLPMGPPWSEVKRLIASMGNNEPRDIRDRALVLLFAVYGFRATEVSTLRLEDIDWDLNLISVARVKRRGQQNYPLTTLVGNAIIDYLRQVRPQTGHRQIFLSLSRPYRPVTRSSLYSMVSQRMKALGIVSTHFGPHALRHACASHLVAEGLSLKEIGDHLGHRSTAATRIYAKVDLAALREVAAFDAGELL